MIRWCTSSPTSRTPCCSRSPRASPSSTGAHTLSHTHTQHTHKPGFSVCETARFLCVRACLRYPDRDSYYRARARMFV